MSGQPAPKRGRGRPRSRTFSRDEAAQLLGVSVARLEKGIAAGLIKADGDRIHERALRRALDLEDLPPRLLSVADFAELIGFSRPWIYDLIAAGQIDGARKVLGQWRIPISLYWDLPEQLPAGAPARPTDI